MLCQEELPGGRFCGGQVVVSSDDEWVYYRCVACGLEAARATVTADPEARRKHLLEQAGLPERFLRVKFEETAENADALRALREWIAGFNDGPVPAPALCGLQGRGKTHLLTALCFRLVSELGAGVMFCSARGLLRELQRFEDVVRLTQTWERARTVDVLALDDLGAQQMTDWRHDQLADLIDERYEAERPIVFATNFRPSDWERMVDERTASRLRGMTFPVELRGVDRRQTTMEGVA